MCVADFVCVCVSQVRDAGCGHRRGEPAGCRASSEDRGEETDGEPPIKCPSFPFHGKRAPKLAMKCYLIGRMPGTE